MVNKDEGSIRETRERRWAHHQVQGQKRLGSVATELAGIRPHSWFWKLETKRRVGFVGFGRWMNRDTRTRPQYQAKKALSRARLTAAGVISLRRKKGTPQI